MAEMTYISATTGQSWTVTEPDAAPPPPSLEDLRQAVQAHIDATAQARLYDSGVTLASYGASSNPLWAAEAQAFLAWRDTVWAQLHALWADPPETLPRPEALIADLPVIAWP